MSIHRAPPNTDKPQFRSAHQSYTMGLTSPLPVSLPQECRKAAKIFSSFVDPAKGLDNKLIPIEILRQARGFAIFTVVKAGFLFSGRAGSGVVIARLDNGEWSAPSAIGTMGAGFGGQVGAELTEFIIVLNSRNAINSFCHAGSLTLGGNMSLAVGPVGRNAEGTGSIDTKGQLAAMYSYSKTKGLFGGVSIEGSVIVERSDANSKAYGYNVRSKQLLTGQVEPPDFAYELITAVSNRAGSGPPDWIDESPDPATTRGRGYSFGTPTSALGSSGASTDSSQSSISKRFTKFAPTLNRTSSSTSKFDASFARLGLGRNNSSSSVAPAYDSDDYRRYHDDREPSDDDGQGVWAADAMRSRSASVSASWQASGEKRGKATRSRSNTVTPRSTIENPFSDDAAEDPRASIDSMRSGDSGHSDQGQHGKRFNFNGQRMSLQETDLDHQHYSSNGYSNGHVAPALPARPGQNKTALALYDFHSSEPGDLPFRKGDVIHIVKRPKGEEWWVGRIGKREGIFPVNYVQL